MAALPDISTIVTNMTTSGYAQQVWCYKDARVGTGAATATISGQVTSLWQYNGTPGSDGTNLPPGSPTNPTNATNGSLQQTDPGGSRQKWLMGMAATSSQPGTLILYDRLSHVSGGSGTTTSAQTTSLSPSRYTSASSAGNQIWIEIYTAIGATSRTITASYTNQDGTAGQTTQTAVIGNTGFKEAQRVLPLTLASGDTGVQAVASVTLSGSTGTAGNFGITIARPIAVSPLGLIGVGSTRDFIAGIPSTPEILPGACLAFAWVANAATAPFITASLSMVEN